MSQTKTPLGQRPHSRVLPLTTKLALSDYERVRADASAHGLSASAYIRQKTLTGTVQPPVMINPVCREQWQELARIGTNLNRILYLINCGVIGPELAAELKSTIEAAYAEIQVVRNHLIGGHALAS
jgi:hypothetical protein